MALLWWQNPLSLDPWSGQTASKDPKCSPCDRLRQTSETQQSVFHLQQNSQALDAPSTSLDVAKKQVFKLWR